jgi:hypothetical protein
MRTSTSTSTSVGFLPGEGSTIACIRSPSTTSQRSVSIACEPSRVQLRFCDEFEDAFGWTPAEPELEERTSHAIQSGGQVWVTDALDGDGVEERIRALGEPAAVVQLLDRHNRGCAAMATRLGVPLHVTPFDGVSGAPFEVITVVRRRRWQEVALWFPAERILVVADALGTADYYRAGDEPVAVHPLLRLKPPRQAFAGLEPLHLLCGHGPSRHGEEVPAEVREALATARRRLPQAWLGGLRKAVRRR